MGKKGAVEWKGEKKGCSFKKKGGKQRGGEMKCVYNNLFLYIYIKKKKKTRKMSLQVIIFFRKRLSSGFCHFISVLLHQASIDLNLRRSQSGSSNKLKVRITDQLACQPKEGLFKVVVGLCRDIIVLEILLSMEGDGLCLDFAFLDIDLVTAKYDGDVFTYTHKITVPVGHVFVGDSGSHIKHDDGTLTTNTIMKKKGGSV
jgi:hypothetical protein